MRLAVIVKILFCWVISGSIYAVSEGTVESERSEPVVILEPKIRIEPTVTSVPVIPIEKLRPFLKKSMVFDNKQQFDETPYVVWAQDNQLVSGVGTNLYVKGIEDPEEITFDIYHKEGNTYIHPVTKEMLGYEAYVIGSAELKAATDPAQFEVTKSDESIELGARVLPPFAAALPLNLAIKPGKMNGEGYILAGKDTLGEIGKDSVVIISGGQRERLMEGDFLEIYRSGEKVKDPLSRSWIAKKILLPDRRVGRLLIFQTYGKLSLALVTEATEIIHLLDVVKSPQTCGSSKSVRIGMTFPVGQLQYLLALVRIPGIGSIKLSNILLNTSDLRTLFDHTGQCLVAPGAADWSGVERDLKWASAPQCHIITKACETYPLYLKEINDPPPVLFVRGNLSLLSKPQIAIVGSRRPTPGGLENAFNFANHFSNSGLVITSGLAIGIDGAAHKGALLGMGGTIAVLGSGSDQIYPALHQSLATEIMEKGGAVVSEWPIGTPPLAGHFPRRNRIISGLSIGTLVVEAALNSGSLITARLALEQGREVFAIPGSIHNPLVKGCHSLISQGAKLVETADDVLDELAPLIGFSISSSMDKARSLHKEDRVEDLLGKDYASLLSQVGYECTPVDRIVERSRLTAKTVSSMLLELELKGSVVPVAGGYVRLSV